MSEIFPFQTIGAEFLCHRQAALLADEQGLGKTIQAIQAMNYICATKILIVCKAGLKINWEIELGRWLWDKKLKIQILSGTKALLKKDTDICIVNYELLAISKIVKEQVERQKWDVGVFDEAHFLKSRNSKRTKAILLRHGIASRCRYKWFMTGTPVLNRPEELYPMLKSCAPEVISPYTTFDSFAKHYCGAWWDGFQLVTTGSSNETELHKKLSSGFMLRRLKKDVLPQLPDKTYQLVTIPPKDKKIKELVEKEFNWEKKDAKKMIGVSSGEEISILRHTLADSKVPQAIKHIKELMEENEKLVVFAYHRSVISELCRQLTVYNPVRITGDTTSIERQNNVERFQGDKCCRLFIGQIQAAGDGITLTAANTVLFVESSWVPGEIAQAADRCHRIGQKNAVLIQFLVIEGSLEEYMLRTVIDKKQTIETIVDGSKTEKGE